MNTAVQLLDGRAELVSSQPLRVVSGRLGPIAIFGPGEVVAYRRTTRRRHALAVFRTLAVDDPLAASVAGVSPRVHLLCAVHTAARVRAVREFFDHLGRFQKAPGALSDHIYARLSAAIAGRPPPATALRAFLQPSSPLEPPWIPSPSPF